MINLHVNKQMLSSLKPLRLEIFNFRHEKEGFSSFLTTNGSMDYSIINETALQILDLCDGKKSIEDILLILVDSYNEIDKDELLKDLFEVLKHLTFIKAIKWVENGKTVNSPFEKNFYCIDIDSIKFEVAHETDIRAIKKFIESSKEIDSSGDLIKYVWGENVESCCNEIVIRQSLFNFSRDYFIIRENNEIVGILICKGEMSKSLNYVTLEYFCLPKWTLYNSIKYIVEYYLNFDSKDISYVSFEFSNEMMSNSKEIKDIMETCGFKQCMIKPKGYNLHDIYVMLLELR